MEDGGINNKITKYKLLKNNNVYFYHTQQHYVNNNYWEFSCGLLTRNTWSKFVRKFWDQVIIYPVFHRSQYDHWSCIVNYKDKLHVKRNKHSTNSNVFISPDNKNILNYYEIFFLSPPMMPNSLVYKPLLSLKFKSISCWKSNT